MVRTPGTDSSVPAPVRDALCSYLEELQHAQGEGLITVRTVGHHLNEERQGTRQLTHGEHHLREHHTTRSATSVSCVLKADSRLKQRRWESPLEGKAVRLA